MNASAFPGSARSAQARRVLVTGGAGFIGSHLTDVLLARGDEVTIIDDLSTGRARNVPAHPRIRFVHRRLSLALADPALGLGRFDEVYHLAASVGVKLVVEDPARCIENNVHETSALMEFVRSAGPGGGPVPTLIASSSEVYGKSPKTPFREDDDVVYGPTTASRWAYAMSKAMDEYLALAAFRQHHVPTIVCRFFNTVGPRQVGEYGMVVPRFIDAALRGEPLQVYGDGSQSRCFCDVRDVASALPQLVASPSLRGSVVNVGSDQPISILALAHLALRITGSHAPVRTIPYTEAYGPGFEDLHQRVPDLTRIRAAIGFRPTFTLVRTMEDVASWLRQEMGA